MPITGPTGNTKQLSKGDGLYEVQYQPRKAPDPSKPWCITNLKTGDIAGRWHMTKSQAQGQLKAMYANMGDKAVYSG